MQCHQLLQSRHLPGCSLLHALVEVVLLEFAHELSVVDPPVTIRVDLRHQLIDVTRGEPETQFANGIAELVRRDVAVAIFVKLSKDLIERLGRALDEHSKLLDNVAVPLAGRGCLRLNREARRCSSHRSSR